MVNHKKEYTFLGSLLAITSLSALVLTTPSASADTSGTVTLTVDVPASCSLTVNPSSHTATINPGNTGLIGTSTIKSICNDPAGLAVYAVGYTNDTYGNNNLSSTVGASTINIATSVTPSGTPATSEWNMTLAAISGDYTPTITTGFDSAHIIPDVYTKVAYRNTMTDIGTNATGAQFTASFNAYIAPTQAAGTYEGKVKFLLVHPNVLTYDSQTGDPDTVQPATLACEPPETVHYDTFDTSVTHYLQDIASWKNQVALEQEVTAYDRRDNQAYTVKRLKMSADGCQTALWMMNNLNLGAESLVVSTLDSSNTHLPTDGSKDIAASTLTGTWKKTYGTGSYDTPELIPVSGSDSYGNKYGTLYNYAAASAGTYVYASGSGTGNAEYDICPSGWRLPTGGSSGEFGKLMTGYGGNTTMMNSSTTPTGATMATTLQSTLKFPLAGYFDYNTPVGQGSSGNYWSSTGNSGFNMYLLYFGSSSVNPAGNLTRSYSYSVRCIAQ